MQNQDQLTRAERLRLEALAQAIASYTMRPEPQVSEITERARYFEKFLRTADIDWPVS